MSSTIRKVAIAGATGQLGKPVTKALAEAGFEVTALTRDAAKATVPAGVKAVTVDYDSEASLKSALKGQDALVSTLNLHKPGEGFLLFDVAIGEGVKRLIPSEFGSDTLSPLGRSLAVFAPKVALQDHIKDKIAGTKSTYTIIMNNFFLDWGLEKGLIIDYAHKRAKLYDGGEVPFTSTPLSAVAAGVVGVLKHPEETANRAVKLHGITVTQMQLLHLYQKYTTKEGWETTTVDTKEGVKKAYELLKTNPGDVLAWLFPMLARVAFGKDADNNWEKSNDDELLGVKPVTQAELEEYVKAAVQ